MPFRTLLKFRNPDLTADINQRFQSLFDKGVFYGGEVLPVAGTLTVQVQPFGAVGADGMVTVLESTPETVAVTPGSTQYIVLHSEYLPSSDPIVELEALSVAAYNALTDSDKAKRIILASVTIPLGAVEATASQISKVEAEEVDAVGRSSFRGVVENVVDLPDYTAPPTGETTQNRPDDIYFVQSERVFYHWNTEGTPQWSPVIAAATELALQDHKQNQDDGTEPPDFIEAQHITVGQREAFDLGSASVAKHGASGTAFGPTNGLVDTEYPLAVAERVDFTGLSAVTAIQLSGTFYVGTGAIGTAAQYFRLAVYQSDLGLIATDRNPITVDQVYNSTNTSPLDPSLDADGLGFYEDPWLRLDFGATIDVSYSGSLTVVASRKQTVGTLDVNSLAWPRAPVSLVGQAVDIPLIGAGFTHLSTSLDNVQAAIDEIDTNLDSLSALPSIIQWRGSEATPQGSLNATSTVTTVRSVDSNALALIADNNVIRLGGEISVFSLSVTGSTSISSVLPYGGTTVDASVLRSRDSGSMFFDLFNTGNNDGFVFRYDSTNSGTGPVDSVGMAIQGNAGNTRVTLNGYPTIAPDRNLGVVGTVRIIPNTTLWDHGFDFLFTGAANQLVSNSETDNQQLLEIKSVYAGAGTPAGSVDIKLILGDAADPVTVANFADDAFALQVGPPATPLAVFERTSAGVTLVRSGTGASPVDAIYVDANGYIGFNGTPTPSLHKHVFSGITATPTETSLVMLDGIAGTGNLGNDDLVIRSQAPGIRLIENNTSDNFRIGVKGDAFTVSIDTDNDEARDVALDGQYDNQKNAILLTANGMAIGGDPGTIDGSLHIYDGGTSATANALASQLVLESSGSGTGMTIQSPITGQGGIYFADSGNNAAGTITFSHTFDRIALEVDGKATLTVSDRVFGTLGDTIEGGPVVLQSTYAAISFFETNFTTFQYTTIETFNANSMEAGSVIRLWLGGEINTVGTATGVQISLVYGGTSIGIFETNSPVDDQGWSIQARIAFATQGATPTVATSMVGGFNGESLLVENRRYLSEAAFDTTVSRTIQIGFAPTSGQLSSIQYTIDHIDVT